MDTVLIRECSVTAIPSGEALTLPSGSEVFITQSLGGNVTVRAGAGLYRIASVDTDALKGFELQKSIPSGSEASDSLEKEIWGAMKQCFDPEIPINIVDLGLIYDLSIEPSGAEKSNVEIKMTLTAQGCGMGPVIAEDARTRIRMLDRVNEVQVDIVWDPVWTPQMISEEGRAILGIE